MDEQQYYGDCYVRLLRFLGFGQDMEHLSRVGADLMRLFKEHPWLLDPVEHPPDFELVLRVTRDLKALKSRNTKSRTLLTDKYSDPYAGVIYHDPAWILALMDALRELLARHGPLPDRSADLERIYGSARRLLEAMPEEKKADYRKQAGARLFNETCICMRVGPYTTLKQIERLWPTVRRAQRAYYGRLPRGRGKGINYSAKILIYDLIVGEGLSVIQAARRARLHPRRALRLYWEAVADIEWGGQGEPRPEWLAKHATGCARCQFGINERGERGKVRIHLCCPVLQRREFGSRRVRPKGMEKRPLAAEEVRRGRAFRPYKRQD